MRFKSKFLLSVLLLTSLSLSATSVSAADMVATGHVDEAISTLKTEIHDAPHDAAAYNLLCRSYFQLRDWDNSVASCEKAASLDPDNSLYHLWLGRAYGEKAGSSNFLQAVPLAKKTRDQFQRAVQLDSKNVPARTDLAEFYIEAPGFIGGGRDKALAQAQALDSLAPSQAHWVRARMAEKEKDPATAEKEYKAAIETSRGNANAWFNLAVFYWHQNNLDEMQRTLYKAVAAPLDRPEVVMESAEVLLRAGRDFPAAIEWLHRYLSGPLVEEAPAFKAHYLLGTLLEKQGNKQDAGAEYRAAIALAKNYSPAQAALKRLQY